MRRRSSLLNEPNFKALSLISFGAVVNYSFVHISLNLHLSITGFHAMGWFYLSII